MMLTPLTDNLWHAECGFSLMGIPGTTRMTVVRLANGQVLLHSPIEFSEALRKEIDALGRVVAIIAPSGFHYLWAGHALAAFPDARLYASPALEGKRPDLRSTQALDDALEAHWRDELDLRHIHGMPKIDEFAFLHRASGTLIVSDLVFNVARGAPLRSQVFLRIAGTYGRFAASRLFKSFVRDTSTFEQSLTNILNWRFERIVMAHGGVVEAGGRAMLAEAYGLTARGTS